MPQPLDNLARQLRAGVLVGNHEDAARLTVEYSEALREHWLTLSNQERVNSPLPKQSLELLGWVRDMTLVQQAMAAQHLALVEKAQRNQVARSLYLQSAALDG